MARYVCSRLYRLACHLVPHSLDPTWRDRMVADFQVRLDESVERGLVPALAVTVGAVCNLLLEATLRGVSSIAARIREHAELGGGAMGGVLHDMRYAIRGLSRAPGFALVIVVTLALAIGANTTLFSVVNGVLLRSLPYEDPQELYQITIHYEDGVRDPSSSFPDFVDIQERLTAAESMTAFDVYRPTLTAVGTDPLRLEGLRISDAFFETLGLTPSAGTFFSREDLRERNADVVVLSYGLWQGRFGGDPEALGQVIELNGHPRTVIGVGPEEFHSELPGVGPAQLFVPLEHLASEGHGGRANQSLSTLVRLADSATLPVAESELDAIMARLREEYPDTNQGKGADLESFHDVVVGDVRAALTLLLGGVGIVLLIAVTNVTSVLLGRAADREREMGLRSALGAAKGRLYGQLVIEGIVLACLGGLAGVVLAFLGTGRLVAWLGETLPRTEAISVDPVVLVVTTTITVGSGLLMGLAPAWSISRNDLTGAIQGAGAGRSTSGPGRQRLRSALVVMQVGLCLTLLTGSGLLIRSFARLSDVDPGVNTDVLTFGLHLPLPRYQEWSDHDAFHSALEERLKQIPGIGEVASINGVPLSGVGICGTLYAEEDPTRFEGGDTCAQVRSASRDYFDVMGIPLLQGRVFTEADDPDADLIVINRATADLLWPGENPLGRRIMTGFRGIMFEVIGVVADVKQFELSEAPSYQTYLWEKRWRQSARNVVMELEGDPRAVIPRIREAVLSIDGQLPLYAVTTLGELKDGRLTEDRIRTTLLSAMSALALVLAVVGIYGVISYSVSKRRREMAIRISIGAGLGAVRRLVLRQALGLIVAGIAIGAVGAVALGRALTGFLYEVRGNDPGTMVSVALMLVGAAAFAAFVPARRATRVDPMLVLREE